MNTYSCNDLNSVWMKQIKKYYIKPEEEADINIISSILIDEITINMNNVANIIIYRELYKRPGSSLHKQLLIKCQIISNISENIKNISINIAKDRYDFNNLLNREYQTEPELIITDQTKPELIITDQTKPELIITDQTEPELIITNQIDMNWDNNLWCDVNFNHSFYSFLDDDMQIINSENNDDIFVTD